MKPIQHTITAIKLWTISCAVMFAASGAWASEQIVPAADLIEPKDCTSLLTSTLATRLTPAARKRLSATALELQEIAQRTLETENSREVFRFYIENFLQTISGVAPKRTIQNVLPHLTRMHSALAGYLNKPPPKKDAPTPAQRRFAQRTLKRIAAAIHAPVPGALEYDAWYFLALDYARSIDFFLKELAPFERRNTQNEIRMSRRGAELSGGNPATLFSPIFLTTAPLSMKDFNEASLVSSILGGINSQFSRYDGGLTGGATTYLFRHDLLDHGTELRLHHFRRDNTGHNDHEEILGLFGMKRQDSREFDDERNIDPALTFKRGPILTPNTRSLESALQQLLDTLRVKLKKLQALHNRMSATTSLTRDAIEVLRFHSDHEHPSVLSYNEHLESLVVLPAVFGDEYSDTIEDIIKRLKSKNDMGDEYPELARLKYSAIEAHLKRAAQILDQ